MCTTYVLSLKQSRRVPLVISNKNRVPADRAPRISHCTHSAINDNRPTIWQLSVRLSVAFVNRELIA